MKQTTFTGTAKFLFRSETHNFSKQPSDSLTLQAGIGIEGDAHAGFYVKHRSRVEQGPRELNLRQVHLMAGELLDELQEKGFDVPPGALGENITTYGLDLINLPRNSLIMIGDEVCLRVEGLRNPCSQIEDFKEGLLAHMFGKGEDGKTFRKTGIMATVAQGGTIACGAPIEAIFPSRTHYPLDVV